MSAWRDFQAPTAPLHAVHPRDLLSYRNSADCSLDLTSWRASSRVPNRAVDTGIRHHPEQPADLRSLRDPHVHDVMAGDQRLRLLGPPAPVRR